MADWTELKIELINWKIRMNKVFRMWYYGAKRWKI